MSQLKFNPENEFDRIFLQAKKDFYIIKREFKLFVAGIVTKNDEIPTTYLKEYNKRQLILKQRYHDLLDYVIKKQRLLEIKEDLPKTTNQNTLQLLNEEKQHLIEDIKLIITRMSANSYPFYDTLQNF